MATERHDQDINIEAVIADFITDAGRASLELPHTMTSGQRKLTKKIVEQNPSLTSESYGFGQDRRLHLFKKLASQELFVGVGGHQASSAVKVKNTFIDDWLSSEGGPAPEMPFFRSVPSGLSGNPILSCIGGNDQVFRSEEVCRKVSLPWQATTSDHSTAASSSGSTSNSPKGTRRELLQKPPGLATPTGLEIRNTFIHFENPTLDERAVQSMPHGMFRKALWAEALSEQVAEQALVSPTAPSIQQRATAPGPLPVAVGKPVGADMLMPGTEVSVVGLLKCPAFNGLSGTVQTIDNETCRYDVLLVLTAGGNKLAKIKRENLQLVPSVPPPPQFSPKFRAQRDISMVSSSFIDDTERKSRPPQTLQLTALV